MFILIGILIGLIIGLFLDVPIPQELIPYLTTFTLVGLDALTSGYLKLLKQTFQAPRFVFRLLVNILTAGLLTALGIQLQFDLALVIAAVFAYRIFQNIGNIGNIFARRWKERSARRTRIDKDS
ncbi:MAG: DUF1290 domain-containing protein [Clostridiaceae bacterium]|nr:DUF1290 domain-containing protein [Clostridiaceae bacterium]